MDLLTSEAPMMLGYLVFAVVVTALTLAADPVYRSRRRHNRAIRHARTGCDVCRTTLEAAGR